MFFDHVSAVLDYGGDHGQYIIDELADASKYVYEVSEAVPDMGVCKLESVDECLLHDYDLIMCCQVLEHVAYPRKVLDDIKAMSGNDTVLYLEVPYESPNRAGKTRRWGRNLKMLFDNPLVIIDVAKLVYGPRYTMHEHVNYFTPMSVQRLLEKTGFNVQAIYLKTIDCGWTVTDNICCVAKTSR
jgi:2-polyprenyl-3-methyl-5-hydroxy-6-metoxy-1,4-benzoquinol methylase